MLSRYSAYILIMACATGLGLFKLACFAHWLSVDAFGKLSFALVLTGPVSYLLGLGLEPFFLRDGSLMAGRGDLQKLGNLRNETNSFALILNAAILGIWAMIQAASLHADVLWWSELALGASLLLTFNLTSTYFRITQRLNIFVNLLMLRQVLSLILGFIWIYYDWSILLSESLAYALTIACSLFYGRMRCCWPRLPLLSRSLKIGLPMSLSALFLNAAVSGDRWILPHFVSAYEYGLYSFGMIAFTAGCGIVNFVTPIIIPKWLRSYGQNKDLQILFRAMMRFTMGVLVAGLLGGVVMLTCLYVSFDYFLVKYRPAFPYICVIALGTVLHMANLWGNFLLTLERSTETLVGQVVVVLGQVLCYAAGYFYSMSPMTFALIFLGGRLFSLLLFASRSFYLAKEHFPLAQFNLRS